MYVSLRIGSFVRLLVIVAVVAVVVGAVIAGWVVDPDTSTGPLPVAPTTPQSTDVVPPNNLAPGGAR